jgi:hypothetical protein
MKEEKTAIRKIAIIRWPTINTRKTSEYLVRNHHSNSATPIDKTNGIHHSSSEFGLPARTPPRVAFSSTWK